MIPTAHAILSAVPLLFLSSSFPLFPPLSPPLPALEKSPPLRPNAQLPRCEKSPILISPLPSFVTSTTWLCSCRSAVRGIQASFRRDIADQICLEINPFGLPSRGTYHHLRKVLLIPVYLLCFYSPPILTGGLPSEAQKNVPGPD